MTLHVAVLVWAASSSQRDDAKVSQAPDAAAGLVPPVSPDEREPMIVELYIEPTLDEAAAAPAQPKEPAPVVPRAPPSPRAAIRVPRPETPDLAPPAERVAPPAERVAPPAERVAPPAERVAPPSDRMSLAMRAPAPSAVAREHGGGLPSLTARPDEGAGVTLAPGATALSGIADVRRDEGERDELVRQRDGTYRAEQSAFAAQVDRDGKVTFDDRLGVRPGSGPESSAPGVDPSMGREREAIGAGGAGVQADATDLIMRGRGIDPHARAKLEFLDRTRDQRVELGNQHRKQQLSQAAVLMKQNIDRLWAETADPGERKQLLFELWDECAESGSTDLVAGGVQARAVVIRTIKSRLRGAAAYTPAELAALNARRRSKATFAPYE